MPDSREFTIAQRFPGTYAYTVYRGIFEAIAPLAGPGALVQVFDATGLIASGTVPAQGTGRWWNVLTIDGATGAITIINEIGDDPAPYPDTAAGCPAGELADFRLPASGFQLPSTGRFSG